MTTRGHTTVLAMPAIYRPFADRASIEFHAMRPDLDVTDRGLAARIMDPVGGPEALLGELLIANLPASFEDLDAAVADADVLITHPGALAGPIVAARRKIRWASSVLAPMSFFSAFEPMVPPQAPWVHALTSRSLVLSRAFIRAAERLTQKWADPVRRFRQSIRVELGGNAVMGGQHSPHLVLAMFSRVLAERQSDWPAHTCVTGPVFYDDPTHSGLSTALQDFLDAGDPPLVFTLGTSAVAAAGAFYDVSAEVAHQLGQRAVLLVGPFAENKPSSTGGEILAVEFASHAALFPRASVVVHQGGIGTLTQALRAGCPMVVVPHAHDQPDNAQRVTRLGVARTLYPKRYRAEALTRHLEQLLGNPRYRERAARVAAVVQSEPGAPLAANAIETLLGS